MKFKEQIRCLSNHQRPIRFLIGYLLWRTGLCNLINFKVNNVIFRFHKSSISRQLFIYKRPYGVDTAFLKRNLKQNDTFIDVGANIGSWSLFAANIVGQKGKVLSFEPHPKTYAFLKKNIYLNKFGKIINSHNVALGALKETINFTSNRDDTNRVTNQKIKNSIPIRQNKLDNYTKDLTTVNLLKLDVEGYEYQVLKGAVNTLNKTKLIYFESNDRFQKEFGYSTGKLITFLNQNNFEVYKTDNLKIKLTQSYNSESGENLLAVKD